MNMKNTILGILGIALIAIVSVGAVSADETLENVGCVLTPSVSEHTYEHGILTIPISNSQYAGMNPDFTTSVPDGVATPDRDDCGDLNDIPGLEAIGAWDYTPCPEPSLPDVRADGNEVMLVGYTPYHGNDDQPSVYDADAWTPYNSEPSSVWLVGGFSDAFPFGDI